MKCKIVMAQYDALVGDIAGNCEKAIVLANRARDELDADVIVFPELYLTGYSPEDFLYRDAFIQRVTVAIDRIISAVQGIHCVIGYPKRFSHGLQNCASVIYNGKVCGTYSKQVLPNYAVFDEHRYFKEASGSLVIHINNIPIGIMICEDIWHDVPLQQTARAGAKIALILNASPFTLEKDQKRRQLLTKKSQENNIAIIYTNLVGSHDGMVFDGGSMAVNSQGRVCVQAPFFKEILMPVDCQLDTQGTVSIQAQPVPPALSVEEKAYQALVLGIRDYVTKNNFPGLLLGLSGGIDSALSLALAVDAIGFNKVLGVLMPSRYTSDLSNQLAIEQAKLLHVSYKIISITPPFEAFLATLNEKISNVANQNIQSRCRGTILMALSNQTGKIVLSTGNRSELAVGYCTLYGDMAGGFCALTDVPKTLVYQLAHYRNSLSHAIPLPCITRAPSAELAEGQRDADTLPPYDILDAILELYINEEKSVNGIVAAGFDRDTVVRIIGLVQRSEFKRRQAPLGVRLRAHAFGRDRRYPMTCGFTEGT